MHGPVRFDLEFAWTKPLGSGSADLAQDRHFIALILDIASAQPPELSVLVLPLAVKQRTARRFT